MLATLYAMICVAGICRIDEPSAPMPANLCEAALSALKETPDMQVFGTCMPVPEPKAKGKFTPAGFIPPKP